MVITTVHEGLNDKRQITPALGAWQCHNFTENLAFDCNGASNDQLSDALATLIGQLMEQGLLRGVVGTGAP